MQERRTVSVVLLGAHEAGCSTLAQALLRAVGAPPASAPTPYRLAVGAYDRGGTRVVLLDPPGSPDLAGELHAGLRTAGAVLLVVSPVQGVDARTVALWESLEHLPRVVALTQLDRPGADADEAVAVCQRVLGEGVLPLSLPLHDDDGRVGGLLDLLHLQVSQDGAQRAADPEHATLVEALRADLLESVLTGSEDEGLFEGLLEDREPPADVLDRELAAAVARGDVQPVVVTSPRRDVGLRELADLLAALPPTTAQPVPAVTAPDGTPVDPADGLVAECVRVGLLRVWSGTLAPGAVLVSGRPAEHEGPVAGPGSLVLTDLPVVPRDTVSSAPLRLAAWHAPPAQFPVGAPGDAGLARRVREDPVARLAEDPRTGQLLLWTYGPEHAEVLLDGLPAAPVRVPPGGRPVAVQVRVPDWAERAVRRDLVSRGAEPDDPDDADGPDDPGAQDAPEGWVVLRARLPPAELPGYALALSRASSGTGWYLAEP